MCTSLTLTNQAQQHFLARTMDFGFQLEGRPVVIPRNYVSNLMARNKQNTAFLGRGEI